MGHGTCFRTLVGMSFLAALAGLAGGVVFAQGSPDPPQPPPDAPLHEEAVKNVAAPCVEPAPMVRLEDYDGPLRKVVGTFARPLERKAVAHPPHYKPGAKLCTLKLKDKFVLFVQDSFDPVAFLATGFAAGLDQAEDTESGCSMRWSTPSWLTATMASACSIFPNGWGRRVRSC